jgi:hypothetical protein
LEVCDSNLDWQDELWDGGFSLITSSHYDFWRHGSQDQWVHYGDFNPEYFEIVIEIRAYVNPAQWKHQSANRNIRTLLAV